MSLVVNDPDATLSQLAALLPRIPLDRLELLTGVPDQPATLPATLPRIPLSRAVRRYQVTITRV